MNCIIYMKGNILDHTKKWYVLYFKQLFQTDLVQGIQAWKAQLAACPLGTTEVMGSNPGKGESLFLT